MRETVSGHGRDARFCVSTVLENGLELIVVENHGVPLVTVEIAVKSGSYVEPPELAGLSHLYEHMFFKGNRALPDQERYMERLRELGASWNGTTGTERVNYYLTVPAENLRDAAAFLRDALLHPLFKTQELDRERVVVLGEFDRNEASPGWHLHHQVDRKLWHRYLSRKVPLGERATISSATREQMSTLQARYYVPNNTAVLFAGDVDPEEAFQLGAELFGPAAWARAEDPHKRWPVPAHPPLERSETIAVLQPVQTATLQKSWHGPSLLEDTPSTFAADALSYILGQPNSRFYKNLVDSGLFDAVGLSYYSQVHTGPLSASGVTSAERLDRAHAALLAELAQLGEPDYFSDEELAFAKDQLEYSEIYSRERTTEFVHTVSFWWATAGLDYFEDYLENLRKVSRADIQAFVRRYLDGQPSVTGLLLSEQDLPKVALAGGAELIRPRTGSSATALQAQTQAPLTELFEIDGLRVLLRRRPQSEVLTVKAFLDGGLALVSDPEQAGLELLLLEVAAKASASFPKQRMARELTRLGAFLGAEAQPDSSTFTLWALKKNFGPSLELFLDALVHPSLLEDEVSLARERRLTRLGAQEEDPDARIERLALETVYGKHPFALDPLGSRGRMAAVRAADLRAVHAQTLSRSRLLLAVAGDLDRAELERLVAPAIRDLPRGAWQQAQVPPIPDQTTEPRLEERDLPTVYLRGYFPAPGVRHPDYPALYLGMSILSNRLFEEIRTKRNLSYAPSAWLRRRSANIGGLYVTSVDPGRCAEIMFETIRGLQKSLLPESRIRNAANEARTQNLASLQSSEEIASGLGDFELHGGWQGLQGFLDALGRVTPEELRAALERHVHGIRFAALGKIEGLDRELLRSV